MGAEGTHQPGETSGPEDRVQGLMDALAKSVADARAARAQRKRADEVKVVALDLVEPSTSAPDVFGEGSVTCGCGLYSLTITTATWPMSMTSKCPYCGEAMEVTSHA